GLDGGGVGEGPGEGGEGVGHDGVGNRRRREQLFGVAAGTTKARRHEKRTKNYLYRTFFATFRVFASSWSRQRQKRSFRWQRCTTTRTLTSRSSSSARSRLSGTALGGTRRRSPCATAGSAGAGGCRRRAARARRRRPRAWRSERSATSRSGPTS